MQPPTSKIREALRALRAARTPAQRKACRRWLAESIAEHRRSCGREASAEGVLEEMAELGLDVGAGNLAATRSAIGPH